MQNQIKKEKYTFIHPTKVSGSAFIAYVHQHYPNDIITKGHFIKANEANKPIVIIRDPYDRFISMYKYWKYGTIDHHSHKRNVSFVEKMKTYNIKDYIQFVKNKDKILVTPFTDHIHNYPQSYWIGESDYIKSIVIYYDKNNMEERIFNLFDYLEKEDNIKNKKIKFKKVNVSDNKLNEKIVLDEEDKKEIYELYKIDFELKIKNSEHLFKKIFL